MGFGRLVYNIRKKRGKETEWTAYLRSNQVINIHSIVSKLDQFPCAVIWGDILDSLRHSEMIPTERDDMIKVKPKYFEVTKRSHLNVHKLRESLRRMEFMDDMWLCPTWYTIKDVLMDANEFHSRIYHCQICHGAYARDYTGDPVCPLCRNGRSWSDSDENIINRLGVDTSIQGE